jgi:hypothetical protein
MARTAWLVRSGRADGGRRRRYQRWAGALAAVVAIGLPLLAATTAEASGPAGEFVSLTNSARSSHGVSRLAVSSDLSAIAHRQAQRMADKGELFHNPKLASEVQNWQKIGENVGYGPDALAIHNAFMHSPDHRANILDSAFRQIGVGVVVKNGVVWVSEVFRQPEGAVATPSPTKPKPKPKPSPTPTPTPTHRASPSSSPVHHVTAKPEASSTPSPTHHASRAPTASPHSSAPPVKHSTSPSRSSAAPKPSVTEAASPTSTSSSSPTVPLAAQGPAAGAPLGTKPADSSSGPSGLAALGTLGILAVLGLALSLRVRSH